MSEWINQYIGIPYVENGASADGCDCYGLLRVVAEGLGKKLPSFDGFELTTGFIKPSLMTKAIADQVESNSAREIFEPVPNSIVTVNRGRVATHIGLVTEAGILHSDRNMGSVLMSLSEFKMMYGNKLRFWSWHLFS